MTIVPRIVIDTIASSRTNLFLSMTITRIQWGIHGRVSFLFDHHQVLGKRVAGWATLAHITKHVQCNTDTLIIPTYNLTVKHFYVLDY